MIALITALVVLMLPGLVVGLAAGVRGWALACTAGMLSYAVIAMTGTICTLTGARYSPAALLGATVVIAAGVAAAGWLGRRRARLPESSEPARWRGWRGLAVLAATALGCGIGFWVVFEASGQLTGVPQDWDATFHGNATRYIAETGNADPAALAQINRYDQPAGFYYPNGYYLMASAAYRLAADYFGADSALPTHTATIALIPPLLTVGLVGLVHRFGGRAALAAAIAVLSAAASALPYHLIFRGPLTPYAVGVVLIPGFLVLLHLTLQRRSPALAVLTGAAMAALMGIHPSVAITAAVFGLALVVQRWLTAPRRLPRDVAPLALAGALALGMSVPAILGSLDSVAEIPVFFWPADLPAPHAIGDLITFSHLSPHPQWFLFLPLLAGLMAVRDLQPMWWVLGASAVFGGLYLLSAAYPQPFVGILNRPWWNDRWRLIAVATLGTILLAAHGTVVLADLTRRWAAALADRLPAGLGTGLGRAVRRAPVAPALVAGVLALGSNGFYAQHNANRIAPQFANGPSITALEFEGIRVLATMVAPDARVLNQNGDGSATMYAIAGIRPVYGHIEPWVSPAQDLLQHRFNRIDTDPEVQAAVARLNIQYVFLSQSYIRPWLGRPEGLQHLDQVHSVELVYENPEVQIYRITRPTLPHS